SGPTSACAPSPKHSRRRQQLLEVRGYLRYLCGANLRTSHDHHLAPLANPAHGSPPGLLHQPAGPIPDDGATDAPGTGESRSNTGPFRDDVQYHPSSGRSSAVGQHLFDIRTAPEHLEGRAHDNGLLRRDISRGPWTARVRPTALPDP